MARSSLCPSQASGRADGKPRRAGPTIPGKAPQCRYKGGAYSRAKGLGRDDGILVQAYIILVHDHRWRHPDVLVAEMAHDERACEYARERLSSSPHYVAVEVWRGAVKLCHLVSATADLRAAA
jgi:hypothetical protein